MENSMDYIKFLIIAKQYEDEMPKELHTAIYLSDNIKDVLKNAMKYDKNDKSILYYYNIIINELKDYN
jgi:hypothetical protein